MKNNISRKKFKEIILPIIKFNSKTIALEKDYGINIHDKYVELLYISIDNLFDCIFEVDEIDYINEFIYDTVYRRNENLEDVEISLDEIYNNLVNKII